MLALAILELVGESACVMHEAAWAFRRETFAPWYIIYIYILFVDSVDWATNNLNVSLREPQGIDPVAHPNPASQTTLRPLEYLKT